jgi:hypothetical protein
VDVFVLAVAVRTKGLLITDARVRFLQFHLKMELEHLKNRNPQE